MGDQHILNITDVNAFEITRSERVKDYQSHWAARTQFPSSIEEEVADTKLI